jgi:hypothetical protein
MKSREVESKLQSRLHDSEDNDGNQDKVDITNHAESTRKLLGVDD